MDQFQNSSCATHVNKTYGYEIHISSLLLNNVSSSYFWLSKSSKLIAPCHHSVIFILVSLKSFTL